MVRVSWWARAGRTLERWCGRFATSDLSPTWMSGTTRGAPIGAPRVVHTGTKRSVDQHRRRILHQLLHAHEEEHRLLAVDHPVVVRERDVHHRADDDLAVHGDRAILRLVETEDADLWEVDDRR